MRSTLCLILCLSCATAISGGGRGHIQVYVDQNSTLPGTGSGTSADPFKTIADALAYVIPHDYILVAQASTPSRST